MTAEDLRKSILQQAIQGKLVPQDPNDEPASELLSKIRAEKERLIKEKKIKRDKNETIIYRGEDNSYYEKILATGEVKCIDEEIPFEIPDSWGWARINSVFLINPKNKCNDELSAAFIPMEKIDAIYTSNYSYDIAKWGKIKSGFTHFANGDVGFAKITPCFQNRKSAVFENLPNGIGAGTTELKILRSYGNLINNYYLLFFLESPYFVDNAKFKGTANQQRIISGYLELKLFPIPPYKEQIQVVNRVQELFSLIDIYQIKKHNLDILEIELSQKLRNSILQYAIQGRLVKQEERDGTAFALLEQIQKEKAELVTEGKLKKSELKTSVIFRGDDNKYYEKVGKSIADITDSIPFEIPDSWLWCRLSSVADLYTGNSINETEKKNKYTNVEGVEYIATKDVQFDHSIIYNNGIAIPNQYVSEFRIAPANSILMCIEGGSAGRKIGILSQDVCFGNKLCCFKPYADISEYIYYYLQSPMFYSIFSSNKNGIIGGVSVNNLKQLLIPMPPLSEIKRIVNKLRKSISIIES